MAKTAKKKSAPAKAGGKTKAAPMIRVLIVEARYYHDISVGLLTGATRMLDAASVAYDLVTVPGALEIPAAIAMLLDAKGANYDGVVALGCVIQGETYHFEIVADQSARALMDLAVARKMPLGNGILTVDTQGQAVARSADDTRNKGAAAARAALAMIALKRGLK